MSAAIAVIRWFHETSLMLLFGGPALLALTHRTLPRTGLRRSAAAVAFVSALLWFVLAAAQMGGQLNDAVLWLTLGHTLFGQVFQARIVLILLLYAGLLLKWREGVLALLSGAALVLIAVTSHAAEASPAHFTAIGIASDGLHLLTVGYWIGALPVLAMLFARREADFARVIAQFAEWGMIAVTILILTGMLNAATILLGGEGHDTRAYLAVLGMKLLLVVAMVGLALLNHFRLLPKLEQPAAANTLFRHIRLEFALGLVVVGLAMMMTVLPPTL